MDAKNENRKPKGSKKMRADQNLIQLKKGGELISRAFPIFPDRTKRMLSYCDVQYNITSGALSAGNYVYSANGLWDPNVTGVGHQPMGFDQMMVFYNHYTVTRAKIIVDFRSQTAGLGGFASIATRADSTTLTDPQRIIEAGFVDYCPLTAPVAASPYSVRRLTRTVDIADFGGLVAVLDNPDYRGNSAANPVEQSYFHLSYWNDETAAAIACIFTVLIEFEAVFTEPRAPTSS